MAKTDRGGGGGGQKKWFAVVPPNRSTINETITAIINGPLGHRTPKHTHITNIVAR